MLSRDRRWGVVLGNPYLTFGIEPEASVAELESAYAAHVELLRDGADLKRALLGLLAQDHIAELRAREIRHSEILYEAARCPAVRDKFRAKNWRDLVLVSSLGGIAIAPRSAPCTECGEDRASKSPLHAFRDPAIFQRCGYSDEIVITSERLDDATVSRLLSPKDQPGARESSRPSAGPSSAKQEAAIEAEEDPRGRLRHATESGKPAGAGASPAKVGRPSSAGDSPAAKKKKKASKQLQGRPPAPAAAAKAKLSAAAAAKQDKKAAAGKKGAKAAGAPAASKRGAQRQASPGPPSVDGVAPLVTLELAGELPPVDGPAGEPEPALAAAEAVTVMPPPPPPPLEAFESGAGRRQSEPAPELEVEHPDSPAGSDVETPMPVSGGPARRGRPKMFAPKPPGAVPPPNILERSRPMRAQLQAWGAAAPARADVYELRRLVREEAERRGIDMSDWWKPPRAPSRDFRAPAEPSVGAGPSGSAGDADPAQPAPKRSRRSDEQQPLDSEAGAAAVSEGEPAGAAGAAGAGEAAGGKRRRKEPVPADPGLVPEASEAMMKAQKSFRKATFFGRRAREYWIWLIRRFPPALAKEIEPAYDPETAPNVEPDYATWTAFRLTAFVVLTARRRGWTVDVDNQERAFRWQRYTDKQLEAAIAGQSLEAVESLPFGGSEPPAQA
eukprot:tig00020903_g15120.t1